MLCMDTKEYRRVSTALKAAGIAIILLSLLMLILVQVAPGLLKSAGFTPKDLGVKYGEKDYSSILAKTGILADVPPSSMDRSAYRDEYSGIKDIDWTLTESEITAWMNMDERPGYWPFSNVQFKVHPDNVIEVSFLANPVKLMTFPVVTKYMPQEVRNFISRIPLQIPVYAKAQVVFTAPKQVDVHMLSFDASSISISDLAMSEQADQMMESIMNDMFGQIGQVNITGFKTSEGSLHLTGTWYQELKRIPVN